MAVTSISYIVPPLQRNYTVRLDRMWCEVSVNTSGKAKYRWYGTAYSHYSLSPAATSLLRPVAAVGLTAVSYPAVGVAYRAIKFLGVHKRVGRWFNKRIDQIADRLALRRPTAAFRRARKARR